MLCRSSAYWKEKLLYTYGSLMPPFPNPYIFLHYLLGLRSTMDNFQRCSSILTKATIIDIRLERLQVHSVLKLQALSIQSGCGQV